MTILAGNQFVLGSVFGHSNKTNSSSSKRKVTPPMLISHDAQEMVRLMHCSVISLYAQDKLSKEERNRQRSLKEYRYM